ncbi:MAG: ABC transporter ATP-binding protein [Anaerolineae bacterium]
MSGPLLELGDVSVRYGGLTALDGVSLQLGEGELLGIIGPNGAGKTTLFNLVSGLVRPAGGMVSLGGRSLGGLTPEAICHLGVGRTWQNIRLFGQMTVRENVALALHARPQYSLAEAFIRTPRARLCDQRVHCEADELLELLGLRPLADERAASLPYGSQRRLELARALGTHPRLLLLDEPSAGMPAGEVSDLVEIIRRVHTERACAVLLIEHNLRVVRALCHQRLLVLNLGRVLVDGLAPQVLADERVVSAYLGTPQLISTAF